MILVVRDVRGRKLDENVSKTRQTQKPNSYLIEFHKSDNIDFYLTYILKIHIFLLMLMKLDSLLISPALRSIFSSIWWAVPSA